MGAYDSHHTGEITIAPPLTWAQIKNNKAHGFQDLKLITEETVTETETGRSTIVTGVAIVPAHTYSYNGRWIREELQSVIDAFPGHEFAGAITARPDDPDGLPWRYIIRDRTVIQQNAQYAWVDQEQP